jgi:hypothetical protein
MIKFKDGKIGSFDPHSTHLRNFGLKSDELQKYIKDDNKKDKNLFGGIVGNTDERNYYGKVGWKIRQGESVNRTANQETV